MTKEQAPDPYSYDRQGLSTGLEELYARIAVIEDEHATDTLGLSWLVMGISDALVDLGVFPIQDIPRRLKSTQEVLAAIGLVLECLREEHASDASLKGGAHCAS
jgi:hypothetical protein